MKGLFIPGQIWARTTGLVGDELLVIDEVVGTRIFGQAYGHYGHQAIVTRYAARRSELRRQRRHGELRLLASSPIETAHASCQVWAERQAQ